MGSLLDKNLPLPKIDVEQVAHSLVVFTREYFAQNKMKKAVLGLSGGIDSALSLAICVSALGTQNVIPLFMPYKSSSPLSLEHAQLTATTFALKLRQESVTPMCDAYFRSHSQISAHRAGNIMARMRMIVLYDYSVIENALVVGASNKSEIYLGYSTLWGDSANAYNPLGQLYKTQVKLLAKHFALPQVVIDKAPSADLWEGQTDEQELTFSYDMADRILYQMIDLNQSLAQIETAVENAQKPKDVVKKIFQRVESSAFKRTMPIIATW